MSEFKHQEILNEFPLPYDLDSKGEFPQNHPHKAFIGAELIEAGRKMREVRIRGGGYQPSYAIEYLQQCQDDLESESSASFAGASEVEAEAS